MRAFLFPALLAALPLAAVELVNVDFTRWNAGAPAGWRENTGAVELKAAPPAGITLKVHRANALDSSLEQLVKNPPKGVTLRFAATVEADQPKMAYLSVKLFRGGKEIQRVNSPLNTSNKQQLAVNFNPAGADAFSVHCRTKLSAALTGKSATFRELRLMPVAVTLTDGWINLNPAECPAESISGGIRARIAVKDNFYGAIVKPVRGLPAEEPRLFSATVRSSRGGVACLTVKLFKGNRELRRFDSRRNIAPESRLEVKFTPGEADRVELLCRPILSEENVGTVMEFLNLSLQTQKEAALSSRRPRVELVPGFEVCSIYLNNCIAADEEHFSAKLHFRRAGEAVWQPALDLVYLPEEHVARGSLLKLTEASDYELRLTVNDNGKRETIERKFRTRSPEIPIARTIELGPETPLPLVIRESGTPTGYIHYTAKPGTVLDGGDRSRDVILVDGASCLVFENLTIRGGRVNGIHLSQSSHIAVQNCDIAGFGRVGTMRVERDGKFYDEENRAINNDAGIRILGGRDIRVERCYIHDPRGTANSWFHSHPAGPNGIFVGDAEQVTLRYNDFIGSDARRWNDAVEGWANGSLYGSVCRDAEIVGNYFAFGNDDGMELDGGQMNCRFLYNKTEGMLCGVSTAPCLAGPSYLVGNLFCEPGDVYGLTNCGLKNGYSVAGTGRLFFFHNTVTGDWNAASDYGGSTAEWKTRSHLLKGVGRNNLFDVTGNLLETIFAKGQNDFDGDLLYSSPPGFRPLAQYRSERNQEKHGIDAKPEFVDAEGGNYMLRPGTPGSGSGVEIPGLTGKNPSVGAFQPETLTDLPFRPVPIRTDVARLSFASASRSGWPRKTVTLTATKPGFRSTFRICRNAESRYFRVEPEQGTIEYGKPVMLTVTIDPAEIDTARLHSGAFLVRLPNGFSRPVSVYADSSHDPELLARTRAGVIYGTVSPQQNGETTLTIDVPESGEYYMFLKMQEPPWLISASLDGAGFRDYGLLRSRGNGPRWISFGGCTYIGQPNRPTPFAAGRHTIRLRQLRKLRYQAFGFALARNPEALLFAPEARDGAR